MRLSLAEDGLNATYFNDTHFGSLYHRNDSTIQYDLALRGQAVNAGDSVSWTGDIGGPISLHGNREMSTYFGEYLTRVESVPSINASRGINAYLNMPLTNLTRNRYYFREHYWSARWIGMITPSFAEVYTFTVESDDDTLVNIWIGGRGTNTNQSDYGTLLINSTQSKTGSFLFTDTKFREIVVELVHTMNDAYFALQWESLSTPKQSIPATAFTHWRNISHYNTTIHPNSLCSSCSTAYGDALTNAIVHHETSFLIYARDQYGNLLQRGGDRVSMLAVGRDGIAFRGKVTDYGNSTYRISYYPTQAGVYLLYITIGCCPPNPGIGYPAELDAIQRILIANTPYVLTIRSDKVDPTRSIAVGNGTVGGLAGTLLTFTVSYRDIFNNPATIPAIGDYVTNITFKETQSGNLITPAIQRIVTNTLSNITFLYQIDIAGDYSLYVTMSTANHNLTNIPIISSPFRIVISPIEAYANHSIARGQGVRQASISYPVSFEIQLYDHFFNKLLTGGNYFYIRVVGDRSFYSSAHGSSAIATPSTGSMTGSLSSTIQSSLQVVPQCKDTQNGRYICTYQPHHTGKHYLYIRLISRNVSMTQDESTMIQFPLNSSSYSLATTWISSPGGSGLWGEYFNTFDGATDVSATPITRQVDAKIAFSWSRGFITTLYSPGILTPNRSTYFSTATNLVIFPTSVGEAIPATTSQLDAETGHRNVLTSLGQSIRWSGYLIAPRTDSEFAIFMQLNDDDPSTSRSSVNVTIFLDQKLIFDSYRQIQERVSLVAYAAYELRIVASSYYVISSAESIVMTLRWSSTSIRSQPIATYYLYPTAQEIPHSPFPVIVS